MKKEIFTEVQFYRNGQYVTKALRGDKLTFIKNRLNNRKSKNMILEVSTYNTCDFSTISSLKF